jgi:hypothetical protein
MIGNWHIKDVLNEGRVRHLSLKQWACGIDDILQGSVWIEVIIDVLPPSIHANSFAQHILGQNHHFIELCL